jgi:hypothetical protein
VVSGDKGDKVKDEENGEKVDGEDKPAEVSEETSIDEGTTNLSPPKAKFRIKDATRAKFRPDTGYSASIAVEA